MASNILLIMFHRRRMADRLIGSVHKIYKLRKKLSNKKIPTTEHYWMMKLFRLLFSEYPITVSYQNPLDESHQIKLSLDLTQNCHIWYYRLRGWYEQDEIRILNEALKDADTYIDVGANAGVFSVTLGQLNSDKDVVAFEALRANYDFLTTNIKANGLENVDCRNMAIGPERKTMPFHINPIHDGAGSFKETDYYQTGDVVVDREDYLESHKGFVPTVELEVIPLDEVIQKKSVIKVDVEGFEGEVIPSMSGAIEKGLVEIDKENYHKVLNFFKERDFKPFLLPDFKPLDDSYEYDWHLINAVFAKSGSNICERIMSKEFCKSV